jgi:hypothetical protein
MQTQKAPRAGKPSTSQLPLNLPFNFSTPQPWSDAIIGSRKTVQISTQPLNDSTSE